MKLLVRFLALIGALVLLAWLCTFQVREGESAIVLRFGSPVREALPGLHFKLPSPLDEAVFVDRRVHLLDPSPDEYLTHDKKNIILDTFLAWRVADPQRFVVTLGSVARAEVALTDVLRSVTSEVVGVQDFTVLISAVPGQLTMRDIDEGITARVRADVIDKFGVEVRLARVKRVNFPAQNKANVYSRMEADRRALARGFRSEGEEEYQKVQARTDREAARLTGEAERTAAEIRGAAAAEVQQIYAEAAARDPDLWRFQRELEVFEASFHQRATVVLPSDHELLRPFLPLPPAAQPAKRAGD